MNTSWAIGAAFALGAGVAYAFVKANNVSSNTFGSSVGGSGASGSRKKSKKHKNNAGNNYTTPATVQSAYTNANIDSNSANNLSGDPNAVPDAAANQNAADTVQPNAKSKKGKKKQNKDLFVLDGDNAIDQPQAQATENLAKERKKKQQQTHQQANNDGPFPALNPATAAKQPNAATKKLKSPSSYANVAKSDPQAESEIKTHAEYSKDIDLHIKPTKPAPPLPKDMKRESIIISPPAKSRIDGESDDSDTEKAEMARILRIEQDSEIFGDEWAAVESSTRKPPTLRVLPSSSSSKQQHSYPVKSTPPQNQPLTKTQLNNQRKAERLKAEKEAVRSIQNERKQQYQKEVSQSSVKEKAFATQVARGSVLEKQRMSQATGKNLNDGTWKIDDLWGDDDVNASNDDNNDVFLQAWDEVTAKLSSDNVHLMAILGDATKKRVRAHVAVQARN
ncbi:hypothetical protein HK100_012611 [Physocladia obscura]|uniref:Uncharacterized protein n=1 Tax=Physocladia obscura TaxID=109957 RepID=A0AAD5XHI0_9FUNG|nr:hypothetical protein HK100_012611 [Physocladia obscura]